MSELLPENSAGSTAPGTESGKCGERYLDIKILFTDAQHTIRALRHAGRLADGLNARMEVLVPQVVPWPLPLAKPDVERGLREQMLADVVRQSGVGATVSIYLCRDVQALLDDVLPEGTLVVVGGRKRARALRRRGHTVVITDAEGGTGLVGRLLHAVYDSAVRGLLAVREGMRPAVR